MRRPNRESVRAAVWLRPAVATTVSLTLALVLLRVRTSVDDRLWPGDVESASTTLQVIATAVITATSLTFSLVVVALQLASQQFSPRLLREFARDGVIQSVLAVLVATFVYALAVLRGLAADAPVPALAVLVGFLLGIGSAAALVGFLSHIARALRVDTMMVAVHADTQRAMREGYPRDDEDAAPPPGPDLPGPEGGTLVLARRSGFVESVGVEQLADALGRLGVFVRVGVRPGDHVVTGTPVGAVWPVERAVDSEAVSAALLEHLQIGYERTFEQDVAFGFRQLTDIAVKALSPGVNDPTTAVHALGYSADLLRELQERRVGPAVFFDADGRPRLVMPDRDPRYYLDLVIGQVRRFGSGEPVVLMALLSLLRHVATAVHTDEQREEVRRQVDLVVRTMSSDLLDDDAAPVHDLARRVRQVLDGELAEAYADRSGETRKV